MLTTESIQQPKLHAYPGKQALWEPDSPCNRIFMQKGNYKKSIKVKTFLRLVPPHPCMFFRYLLLLLEKFLKSNTYCFPRTSLSTSHEIPSLHNNGNGVLLYWSGSCVFTLCNVCRCRLEEPTLVKRGYVSGGVTPTHVDGYVVIAIKIDPGIDGFKYGAFIFRG